MIHSQQAHSTGAVAAHYDELDQFYREVWGEHIHHGLWATGRESAESAAIALVELVADRLELRPGLSACDIGCGYGATAQYLAERCDINVTGITISSVQARRARARSTESGGLRFLAQNWLANDIPDACFDRAYAIESSEHMEDKQLFFDQAFRVLRPGGLLVVCAWLARKDPRIWEIDHLLEPICREGRLPSLGSETDYRALAQSAGFNVLAVEDLSNRVSRTWSICIRRGLQKVITRRRYRQFLFDRSAANRVFAITLFRIMIAYQTGSLRYGLFVLGKPNH